MSDKVSDHGPLVKSPAAASHRPVTRWKWDHPEITPRSYGAAGDDEKVKKLLNILQSRYPEYFQRLKTP